MGPRRLVMAALAALCLSLAGAPRARAGEVDPLLAKLDRALGLVRTTPGFELYSRRLDALRAGNDIRIADLKGVLAEVYGSDEVLVTRKLLRSHSVPFIASTLVHEAVHLGQDDSRYAYVEEIEFKAYQVGGRFKQRVGLEPTTLERAAMRLTRKEFIREAHSIFQSYDGLAQRKKVMTLEREGLSLMNVRDLRAMAAEDHIRGARHMSRQELVDSLADRFHAGGLARMRVRDLRILARQQGMTGTSKSSKGELIDGLRARLDVHRLGIYSMAELRQLATRLEVPAPHPRTRRGLIEALARTPVPRARRRPEARRLHQRGRPPRRARLARR